MNVGELNKKIKILKRVLSTDENGFEVEDWIDFKTVWANINNLNGKESIQAQQLKPEISKKVTIRYIKDLDTSINPNVSLEFKAIYKNNNYNIKYSVNIKEENRYLEMLLEGE